MLTAQPPRVTAGNPRSKAAGKRGIIVTRKHKFFLLAASLLFCLFAALAGEAYCRLFLDISLQGNSRHLFVANAFGESMGNARNVKAVSFGVDVYTDDHGFRRDPGREERTCDSAVLILGDSVAFGPGVEESKTFAGLLRRSLTGTTVYNSSVIGYALPDYRNVLNRFVPDHPEVRKVYLVFCLNDVSSQSALNINRFLNPGGDGNLVDKARGVPVVGAVNEFLRSRSELYLAVKDALTNPRMRYFQEDLGYYSVEEGRFAELMQPALDIDRACRERGIEFTVVIAPCEPQVSSTDPSFQLPQQKLADYLGSRRIRYIDPLNRFRRYPGDRGKLYLSGDAVHFSAAGHRLFYEVLWGDLRPEGRL